MTASASVVHPRKLYAALVASPSSSARAHDALQFLCSASGAERGYLFVEQLGELVLAASHRAEPPSAELLAEVRRLWGREFDIAPDSNRTLDVHELQATSSRPELKLPGDFQPRALSTYRTGSWCAVGILALQAHPERPLELLRQAHIDAICNAFLDAPANPGAAAL